MYPRVRVSADSSWLARVPTRSYAPSFTSPCAYARQDAPPFGRRRIRSAVTMTRWLVAMNWITVKGKEFSILVTEKNCLLRDFFFHFHCYALVNHCTKLKDILCWTDSVLICNFLWKSKNKMFWIFILWSVAALSVRRGRSSTATWGALSPPSVIQTEWRIEIISVAPNFYCLRVLLIYYLCLVAYFGKYCRAWLHGSRPSLL